MYVEAKHVLNNCNLLKETKINKKKAIKKTVCGLALCMRTDRNMSFSGKN